MVTSATPTQKKIRGGNFLIEETNPQDVFTPEDFSDQHKLIEQTAENFAVQEIVPNADRIEQKDFAFSRDLLKKAAELGLTSVDIPEEYGGAEMDKVSSSIIADRIAKSGLFRRHLQCACRHRHSANCVVWHRGAEKEISAAACRW